MDLLQSSVAQMAQAIQKKQVSCEELLKAHLGQIDRHNKELNVYVRLNDKAEERAKSLDGRLAKGEELGPLGGVPIAIKDMFNLKGQALTAASKILDGYVSPYTATVVQKLEDAGAIIIGHLNQDEFAMGSSNEVSNFGPCKNPWDASRVPGGSSGGSAAAVAARMAAASLGTDTGGSIRQPANFCGVVGVKPTYGRVSRYGIIAFASSLDQAGPLTRTVEDSALLLENMCGKDKFDQTTATATVPQWSKSFDKDIKGLRVGLPKEYFDDGLDHDVRQVVETARDHLKSLGAELVEVTLPHTKYCVPVYYIVATCEASSNLSRYDGVRFGHRADFSDTPASDLEEFYSRTRGEGFGDEVKRRVMLGAYALSSGYYDAYYNKACQVRRLIRDDFTKAFEKCDVLLSPVTTSPAFKIGERISDPLDMYMNDIFTTSTNLAGLPGMSVPAGLSDAGLPIGVQLTGPHFKEETIFKVAHKIEQMNQCHEEVPRGLR